MALQTVIMSANHIAAQGGAFEPQRQNHGLLFIEGLAGFGDQQQEGNSILTLALDQIPTPKRRQDPIELPFLSQTRKVAGAMTYDDMEVVFRDFVDVPVYTVLSNWSSYVGDPVTGRIGLARNYKKTGYFHALSPDGTTSRCLRIEGMWPSAVDAGDYDMGSSEKQLINVSFCIDKAYPVDAGHLLRNANIDWRTALSFVNQIVAATTGLGG